MYTVNSLGKVCHAPWWNAGQNGNLPHLWLAARFLSGGVDFPAVRAPRQMPTAEGAHGLRSFIGPLAGLLRLLLLIA